MKTQLKSNHYQIKWTCIISVFDKPFSKQYQRAFLKAGFLQIRENFFATHCNIDTNLFILNKKIKSFKRKRAILAFKITDRQFGLIGKCDDLPLKCKIPSDIGLIPVTYKQMYNDGIALEGSQRAFNQTL